MSAVDGRFAQPTDPQETEKSAFREVGKQTMAIVREPVEISLTQLGGGEEFRQPTVASKPLLPYIQSIRVRTEAGRAEKLPTETLAKLIERLPKRIQHLLQQNGKLPFAQKDAHRSAFGRWLGKLAGAVDYLRGANRPVAAGSTAEVAFLRNQGLARLVFKGALQQGDAVAQELLRLLLEKGPNWPHFDRLMEMVREFRELLKALKRKEQEEREGKEQEKEELEELAEALDRLEKKLNKIKPGKEFEILAVAVRNGAAAAHAVASSAAPALYVGFKMAMEGLEGDEGLIGPTLKALVQEVADGAVGLSLPAEEREGTVQLMRWLSEASFLLILTATAHLLERGMGPLPGDPSDHPKAEAFAFDLTVSFTLGADLLLETFHEITKAAGLGKLPAELLHLVCLLLLLTAASEGAPERFDELLELSKGAIKKSADRIEAHLSGQIEAFEATKGWIVLVQQLRIALESGGSKEVSAAVDTAIKKSGFVPEKLRKELHHIRHLATFYADRFTTGLEEQKAPPIGVFQQA